MADSDSKNAEAPTSPTRRRLKLIALVVVGVAAAIWLAFWLHHRLTHVSENDAHVAAHEITVSSRLAGRVTGFDLIEGDRLHTGETVATLYSRPARLKLAELTAELAHMKAELALAQQQIGGGVKSAKAMLDADRAATAAAKARMEKAHENYVRAERLYQAKGGTKQQRDIDRYDYQSAKAEYRRAKSRVAQDAIAVTNAETGLLGAGQVSNPKVLKSQLAVAKAKVAHQKNLINDLRVASPIDGVVDKTFIEQAEYVAAGQPIVMMHDPNDVWIVANIKETEIGDLAVGQPVAIHVDAWPNINYRGHVQVIGQAATDQFALLPDPNPSGNFTKITQRIPVRIAIDHGPKRKLAPGMMVEVDIAVTGHANTTHHQQQRPIPTRGEQIAPPASAAHGGSPAAPNAQGGAGG